MKAEVMSRYVDKFIRANREEAHPCLTELAFTLEEELKAAADDRESVLAETAATLKEFSNSLEADPSGKGEFFWPI